ncbi:LLM class flavin-dependent oxidoreductase [Streptomyces sp. NPDC003691]
MKFSYGCLPDYPLADLLPTIELADELGFYGCYPADETWHKDIWVLLAAAATRTRTIRLGPSVSPMLLRDPTHVAQAVATLDELSGGRAEAVLSSGNTGLLEQYGIDASRTKPLSRTKEALHVVRTLLDEGTITFDGEFYSYDGLFTFARPVQERVPLKLGGMRGPRTFEAAGELSDGCHHALSYTREAHSYMVDRLRAGAERAGKDVASLDIGAWVVFATAEDSAVAREAARSMVGIYASAMSDEQVRRNGVNPAELKPVADAVRAGDLARGIELTTPELTERLSVSGTPEECAEKIRDEIAAAGVNHLICGVADRTLVKAFAERDLPEVPGVREQLRLIHDRIMPAFT